MPLRQAALPPYALGACKSAAPNYAAGGRRTLDGGIAVCGASVLPSQRNRTRTLAPLGQQGLSSVLKVR